jgi:hypothetical protein
LSPKFPTIFPSKLFLYFMDAWKTGIRPLWIDRFRIRLLPPAGDLCKYVPDTSYLVRYLPLRRQYLQHLFIGHGTYLVWNRSFIRCLFYSSCVCFTHTVSVSRAFL